MKRIFLCALAACMLGGCTFAALPSSTQTTEIPTTSINQKIVAIDAGHQAKGNYALEPIGPGATEKKAKVSSGTEGVATGVPEYQLNLDVAKRLRDQLLARGYEVIMIRESHDVDISNRQRAEMATQAGAQITVRVHANGSENPKDNGILMVVPTPENPFVPHLYQDSRRLADDMLTEMLALTGAHSKGVWETDTMSGINWSTMPVVLVEMGYMTNPAEDKRMQEPDYQEKLAAGMANGIDRYFGEG